jgi:hypothetical protein
MKKFGDKPKLKGGSGKPPQIVKKTKPRDLPVRAQKVRAKHEMHAGTIYEGWRCKNEKCGLVIAVNLTRPGSKPILQEPDDFLAKCTCPHCQIVDLYRWNTRKDLPYWPQPKSS